MAEQGSGNIGGRGDYNQYSAGKFAHPNLDFGELQDRNVGIGGRHIFNALSEIQRYHVIEERSDEIPKEYFTIEQILDYFKIGFKSGMLESFIFSVILCIMQVIYPSYKFYFLGKEITQNEYMIFEITSYAPILISTVFMIYISKYYRGFLTRRAIFALMNGRSLSFLLKGIALFYLFKWLYTSSLDYPYRIYTMADWTVNFLRIFDINLAAQHMYIYYYKYAIPALHDTSYYILYSMCLFAVLPYFTIFFKGYRDMVHKRKNKDTYEQY